MKTLLISLISMVAIQIVRGQTEPVATPGEAPRETRAFVLGLVKEPGTAQRVTRDLTLLKAIDAAGGTKAGKIATVIRQEERIVFDLAKLRENPANDPPLIGWDVVLVSADRPDAPLPPHVAVVGDLHSPRLVPYAAKITAVEALMMAGGWTDYGGSDLVFIIRDLKVMRFEMREILRRKSRDPELQPWDIVWHPSGAEFLIGLRPESEK